MDSEPDFFSWPLSSEEEMDAMIMRIADLVSKWGMETPAILFFDAIRPLVLVGGGLAKVFVSPWLHMAGINTRTVINTLEEPKNVEKLVRILEQRLEDQDKRKKDTGKEQEGMEEKKEAKGEEAKPKKGWRRFFRR